jgi:hypothetical protein
VALPTVKRPNRVSVAAVPELAVFGCIGLAGLGYARRRKVVA